MIGTDRYELAELLLGTTDQSWCTADQDERDWFLEMADVAIRWTNAQHPHQLTREGAER